MMDDSQDQPHSIDAHPMRQFDDFAEICNDVQFGRISWPICVEIVESPNA